MDSVGLGECSGTTLMYSPFEYLVSGGAAFTGFFEAADGLTFFFNAILVAPSQVWDVHVSCGVDARTCRSVQVRDAITTGASAGWNHRIILSRRSSCEPPPWRFANRQRRGRQKPACDALAKTAPRVDAADASPLGTGSERSITVWLLGPSAFSSS